MFSLFKPKKKRKKKSINVVAIITKLFFGLGINYLMINFPFFVFCKYGYTSLGVGITKRQKGIDRDMPGTPVPVFFVVSFFALPVEKFLHFLMAPLRANFYKGSGHTETYFILAAIFFLAAMLVLWALNIAAFYIIWKAGLFLLSIINSIYATN